MTEKNTSLEERIKQYYQNQILSLDALTDLKQNIEQTSSEQRQVLLFQRFILGLSKMKLTAVAIVMIFCLSFGLFALHYYTYQQQLEAVATEIALNHAKGFDTEFVTDSIANLSKVMPLLDFAPVHPRRMQFDVYDVLGARYCTIDSSIAVQVHLKDDEHLSYTLYEFRPPPSLSIEREAVIQVDDIQVTLWQEGEVVMGLAHQGD